MLALARRSKTRCFSNEGQFQKVMSWGVRDGKGPPDVVRGCLPYTQIPGQGVLSIIELVALPPCSGDGTVRIRVVVEHRRRRCGTTKARDGGSEPIDQDRFPTRPKSIHPLSRSLDPPMGAVASLQACTYPRKLGWFSLGSR